MTPATKKLESLGLAFKVHEYVHSIEQKRYGLEAAEKLQVASSRVFKTLVVEGQNAKLAVAVLPVNQSLDLKALAKILRAKKVQMADPRKVERSTGYVLGGVSPIAQKQQLPTFIDASAADFETIFFSGGRRGLEIELAPELLLQITRGSYGSLGSNK